MKVKICGLVRPRDARAADRHGAAYLGTVVTPGFTRSLEPPEAARVLEGTAAERVAVVVDEPVSVVVGKAEAIGASVVQLHGHEDPDYVAAMRDAGPWRVWKAVRVEALETLHDAVERYAPFVDALLVEGVRAGVLGGGGARLELDPAAVRAAIPVDVGFVLAGGLRPWDVREAVALFAPDVVDVSSGVESAPGRKDEALVAAFVSEATGRAPQRDAGRPSAAGGGEPE